MQWPAKFLARWRYSRVRQAAICAVEQLEERKLMSATVSGTVYNNLNLNLVHDTGEAGVAGQTVFVDANDNAVLDSGETCTTTDSSGNYTLTGLTAATDLQIMVQPTAGWLQTPSATSDGSTGAETVNVPNGTTATVDFGVARSLQSPIDLAVDATSSTTADLSWLDPVKKATGYFVQYSDNGGAFTTLDDLGASVVSRSLFYNDSSLDGNNTAANTSDFSAIATDRAALLPGQDASSATTSPISGYSRGINGIIVDIADLDGRTPTASDFVCKVGDDNSPSGWSTAPTPASVTVFAGDGVGGSDRVEITWANNAIENEWLQVTVKADNHTGLSADDVFYYGSLIADTNGDGMLNSTDSSLLLANFGTTVTGGPSAGDVDVNGVVNGLDTRAFNTNGATSINLLEAPAANPDGNYHVTGLTSGHDYAFRIAAYDANGDANFTAPVDANAPQAVTNLEVLSDGTAGTMTISWTMPASGPTPSGFYVYDDATSSLIATVGFSTGLTDYSTTYTLPDTSVDYSFKILPFATVGTTMVTGASSDTGAATPAASGHKTLYSIYLYSTQFFLDTPIYGRSENVNFATVGATPPVLDGITPTITEVTTATTNYILSFDGPLDPHEYGASAALIVDGNELNGSGPGDPGTIERPGFSIGSESDTHLDQSQATTHSVHTAVEIGDNGDPDWTPGFIIGGIEADFTFIYQY